MDSLWLLLYSKFSPACTELINIIKSNNTGITLESVCVDNIEVRRRLARSKKFNIEHVPCILHINKSSGIAEQYEGERSFSLIHSLIEAQIPEQLPPLPEIQTIPELPVQPPHVHVQPPQETQQATMIDDLDQIQDMPPLEIKNVPSALKQKVSPGEIMAMAKGRDNDSGIKTNPSIIPSPNNADLQNTVEKIEQKKTGKPVDIAAAMAAAQSRRE